VPVDRQSIKRDGPRQMGATLRVRERFRPCFAQSRCSGSRYRTRERDRRGRRRKRCAAHLSTRPSWANIDLADALRIARSGHSTDELTAGVRRDCRRCRNPHRSATSVFAVGDGCGSERIGLGSDAVAAMTGEAWVATTEDGRFDANDIESLAGLRWVVADQPLRAEATVIGTPWYVHPPRRQPPRGSTLGSPAGAEMRQARRVLCQPTNRCRRCCTRSSPAR
jgi:hypothetical protein